MRRRLMVFIVAAVVGGGAVVGWGQTKKVEGAAEPITPEMLETLRQLSNEDYKTRQEAVAKLQQAIAKHFQQMVYVQDLMLKIQTNLAEQLKQLTLVPDNEGAARTASLMEFNHALSRWAIDVMQLPEKERTAMLDWGIKQENIQIVARAYHRKNEVRIEATKELAKVTGANATQADWLLAQLLNDGDREVSLMAMDAIWDRPANAMIIDTLWTKATAGVMNQIRPRNQQPKVVTVRGRTIQIYEQDYRAQARAQDADVAVDLLIKQKNDEVNKRLGAMFTELMASAGNPNDYRWTVFSPNYGDGGRAMSRLIEAYKPREAAGFFMKVMGSASTDGYDTTIGNNEKYRQSTRCDAAGVFMKIVNLDPDEFGLRKVANYGDRWMVKGGQPEENEMVKKLQEWWKKNAKEYGVEVEQTEKTTEKKPEG